VVAGSYPLSTRCGPQRGDSIGYPWRTHLRTRNPMIATHTRISKTRSDRLELSSSWSTVGCPYLGHGENSALGSLGEAPQGAQGDGGVRGRTKPATKERASIEPPADTGLTRSPPSPDQETQSCTSSGRRACGAAVARRASPSAVHHERQRPSWGRPMCQQP
jgi:hypothetical protein